MSDGLFDVQMESLQRIADAQNLLHGMLVSAYQNRQNRLLMDEMFACLSYSANINYEVGQLALTLADCDTPAN